ncbi:hypothetical protein [Prosthecobacter sp.]|uniref:hypothetical protein n=1 Tax=Prosthecobacter sp. TaxID=1965333 RepID=UPI002489EFF2|nr:hypothetical protein [Prosthecobacter sp.]MDI1312894.1 hypothetical protein [Prosthecobacter sp.]
MTKKQKKKAILAAVAVAVIAAIALLLPKLWQSDFRTELAKVLNEDAKQLVLNVPPADGLLPGSIFVKDHQRLIPFKRTLRNETAITQGADFVLGWNQMADASGKAGMGKGGLGALFGDTESAKIEVRATQCRVLDMDSSEITKRVKTQEVMDLAADETKEVAVIVRAYEGILETKIRRTSQATAEAWRKVQEQAKSAESVSTTGGKASVAIQGNTDDEVVVVWKEPVVFACVVQKVTFFAKHLGTDPDEVMLEKLDGEQLSLDTAALPHNASSSPIAPESPWALLTISSGYYPKNAGLRQDWNAISAGVFESSLQPWKPALSRHLWATSNAPLQREALLAEVRDFFPLPVLPGLNGR